RRGVESAGRRPARDRFGSAGACSRHGSRAAPEVPGRSSDTGPRGGEAEGTVIKEHRIIQSVRIRRTGNSNAISRPRDFEELGYVHGAVVVVMATAAGELLVLPQDRMRQIVQGVDGAGTPDAAPQTTDTRAAANTSNGHISVPGKERHSQLRIVPGAPRRS